MRSRLRSSAAQLARYLVVGASNTAVSYAAYLVLLDAGAPTAAAAAAAFAAGAVNGYVLNRRFTFHARDGASARIRYLVVQLVSLAGTTLLVAAAVDGGVAPRLAYALALPPITLAGFAANRRWTFA